MRDASLRLLFRFLFLLYAEDRDLLPVRHDGYRQYGLQPMRDEAAGIVDGNRTVSDQRTTRWPRLTNLFGAIANGDTEMGLPPYKGGLFDDREAPLLSRIALPDRTLAGLIDALSRDAESRRWINYRDLSVQHLGSIYKRLLEHEVAAEENGQLTSQPSIFARKTTGSYDTPEELVRLILRRAVGPLLADRRRLFTDRAKALASDDVLETARADFRECSAVREICRRGCRIEERAEASSLRAREEIKTRLHERRHRSRLRWAAK